MVLVPMDDQNKNLILATVLSFLVILGWFVAGPMLFPQWFPAETQATEPLAAVPDAPAATTAPRAPSSPRWLLVEGATLPACVDKPMSRNMGNANRREWWLLPERATRACAE